MTENLLVCHAWYKVDSEWGQAPENHEVSQVLISTEQEWTIYDFQKTCTYFIPQLVNEFT